MGSCAKITIIVFNVVLACVFLGLGSYGAYKCATSDQHNATVGGVVATFFLAGICLLAVIAAACESRCLLITYIILVSLGIIIQIVIASVVIVHIHSMGAKDDYFLILIGQKNATEFTKIKVKEIQEAKEAYMQFANISLLKPLKEGKHSAIICCGCIGDPEYDKEDGVSGPCPPHIMSHSDISDQAKKTQCCHEFYSYLTTFGYAFAGIMAAIVLIEIIAIVFACVLCTSIGRKNTGPPPMAMNPQMHPQMNPR